MTHSPPLFRFDSSDAARIARAWRTADAWLAGLLSLVGWTGLAAPRAMSLSHAVRLEALRGVRKLEALLRRLCLARAAAMARKARPAAPATPPIQFRAPPAMTRLPLRSLGLAHHWRPGPPARPPSEESAPPAPRRAIAPTISLAERWHPTGPSISDHPFDPPPMWRSARLGPQIRSFDAPVQTLPDIPAPSSPKPGNMHLARRIAAIRAVLADPTRMVRRMARWLERRRPSQDRAYRHTPLCMGLPRLAFSPDERDTILAAHHGAGDAVRRLDSG